MARDVHRRARLARPCRIPAGLGLALHELGLKSSAVLTRAGLPADALDEPRPWLSIEDYFALWDAIAVVAEDPTAGLRLGSCYPEHVLEAAFLACLGSRNLDDALGRLVRYKRTLCPETLTLQRHDRRVHVHYAWPTARRRPPEILVDAELSFLLHLARKATRQPLRAARVALTRPGSDPSPYRAVLGAEVRLGVRIGTLSLLPSDLELPFATFNPSLLSMLDPALQAEQSVAWSVQADAVAVVRQALRRRLADGRMSLRDVATELGTSARTLQRQLREAGTSFGELLRDTRREQASFYLRQSELSLSEIAFLVGFDTPSSFFRMFARWTGQTPRAYRERAVG